MALSKEDILDGIAALTAFRLMSHAIGRVLRQRRVGL